MSALLAVATTLGLAIDAIHEYRSAKGPMLKGGVLLWVVTLLGIFAIAIGFDVYGLGTLKGLVSMCVIIASITHLRLMRVERHTDEQIEKLQGLLTNVEINAAAIAYARVHRTPRKPRSSYYVEGVDDEGNAS